MQETKVENIKTLTIDKILILDGTTKLPKRECPILRNSDWHILNKTEWEKLKSDIDYFYNTISDEEISKANQEVDMDNTDFKTFHNKVKVKGFVYFIQAIDTGFIKIGRTIDINSRFKPLSIQLPFKIKLLGFIESDDCIELEQKFHLKYSDKRLNGEWFDLCKEEIHSLMEMVNE